LIISEMQHKLATWAESDPNRRFDRLLRLIADRAWLAEAARITLASSGAKTPGIDGMDKQRMQDGLAEHLASLRTDLLTGNYTPQPVRRIYIPKANGKKRPLGIPNLKDRIVQRAMLMAMEPIWESDFHRLSYGFRPERSVHHAVRTVKIQLQDSGAGTRGRWIIEGDLASYFDMVDRLNRQLAGWAAFYKFTDFTARIFRRIDHVVFWRLAHWLARKYRSRIKLLMRSGYRAPEAGKAKTWLVYGRSERGDRVGKALRRMVSSPKAQFRWRNPENNPYIFRSETRSTVTSNYYDVAMAMGQD
jgi:hypothetical protein